MDKAKNILSPLRRLLHISGWQLLVAVLLLILVITLTGNVGFWLAVGTMALIGLALLFSLVSQLKDAIIKPAHRLYTKDFSLKFLATLMGFLLVLGTLLYFYVFHTIEQDEMVGYWPGTRTQFSNAEYLFRSLICSLDLFMLDVDGNLLDKLAENPALKGWLMFQAVLSFSCTVAMLVGLVYSRIHAYYRLNYATRITKDKNHLYLFFGHNKPSELLIKEVVNHDPRAVVIVIDQANVKEDDNDEWGGIVSLIAHKRKIFNVADKYGAQVAIAGQHLYEVDSSIASRPDFDALAYLGLGKIKKFINELSKFPESELHIFFLDEDEDANIRNINVLSNDITILALAEQAKILKTCHNDKAAQQTGNSEDHNSGKTVEKKWIDPIFYCHARSNGANRVIEDMLPVKNLTVKIIDSSHIAVELLKLDPCFHPVQVVETDKEHPITVTSPLKTMIIGFGTVGRDAFRFLYEFGAFVDARNPDMRSPFECTIVDKDIDNIAGSFMASMPAIFIPDENGRIGNPRITFENLDCKSSEFYEKVLLRPGFLQTINYIVISISDNDEAIQLATRLFTLIHRVRPDLSNLRIMVRVTDNKKLETIQQIANHYNFGYGSGDKNTPVINIFGQPEQIFTFQLIISQRLEQLGKRFFKEYSRCNGGSGDWQARRNDCVLTPLPVLDLLRKLHRKESQDKANAMHALTKMTMLRRALTVLAKENGEDYDLKSFVCRYFNDDDKANVEGARNHIHYPGLTDRENEIILHLAMLEHIRWNAAHELMGYVFDPEINECDERTMRHNCLCPWSLLDHQSDMTSYPCDYKKYDFCVVDTTLAFKKNSL